jgi:hypothetical protein
MPKSRNLRPTIPPETIRLLAASPQTPDSFHFASLTRADSPLCESLITTGSTKLYISIEENLYGVSGYDYLNGIDTSPA